MTNSENGDSQGGGLPTVWIAGGLMAVVAVVGVIFWIGFRSIDEQPAEMTMKADPANLDQVTIGAEIYRTQCAVCHGADLAGQPGWDRPPAAGPRPAPPHNETGHTWHHGDQQIFDVVKHGPGMVAGIENYDGGMPGFENDLSDDEIWAAIAFIKNSWPETIRARQHAASMGEAAVHAEHNGVVQNDETSGEHQDDQQHDH